MLRLYISRIHGVIQKKNSLDRIPSCLDSKDDFMGKYSIFKDVS
jgi:hypothetical protein